MYNVSSVLCRPGTGAPRGLYGVGAGRAGADKRRGHKRKKKLGVAVSRSCQQDGAIRKQILALGESSAFEVAGRAGRHAKIAERRSEPRRGQKEHAESASGLQGRS